MKNIIFCIFLVSQIILSQQTCGIQNIFQNEYQMNQSGVLFSQQNLPLEDNGQKITIYGWFQIYQDGPQIKPLLQLIIQTNQTTQVNNQTIIQLTYDTTNPQDNFLIIQIADSNNTNRIQTIQTQIPYNVYIFTAVSLDYSQGIFKLYMQTYSNQNYNLQESINITYPDFILPQNFVINIGFINNQNLTDQQILDNSLIGTVKDFSYILEYFDDLSYLVYVQPQVSTNLNFLFDAQSQQNKLSRDITQTQYTYDSNNYSQDGQIILKGNNTLEINPNNFFVQSKSVESPGIFIQMSYKEQLGENFSLFQILDQNNESSISARLIKGQQGRILKVAFTGTQIQYEFPQSLLENKQYQIYIVFLRIQTQLQIMIIVNDNMNMSQQYTFPFITNGRFVFGQNQQEIQGQVQLSRINFLDNSSGIFYKKFSQNSNCFINCNFLGSIQNQDEQCLVCPNDLTLDTRNNQCNQYCAYGYKSINNICYACQKSQCAELNQLDFQLEKIERNKFKLTKLNDRLDLQDFTKNFNVQLNDQPINNYQIQKTNDQNQYIYTLDETIIQQSPNANFRLVPNLQLPIIKSNNNLYQRTLALNLQNPLNTVFPIIQNSTLNLPSNIITPIQPIQSKKIEIQRDGNSNYERLGKAAFGIFIGSLFFGILGLFYRCPYQPQDWNDFHYQKFIQTFLMTQYFSCWLFYHVRLHDTLYGFLDKLFYYTIGWHKVFENVTKSDYNSSQYFNNYYNRIIFRRFFEEQVYTTFLTNFSVIMIIQGSIIIVYIILKVINIIGSKKQNNDQDQQIEEVKKPIYYFEWNILITLFLIFIVETTLFIIYNFWHQKFHHRYFLFSLLFSILYLLINIGLLGFVFMSALKEKQNTNLSKPYQIVDDLSGYYISNRRTQFIWRGLENSKLHRLFHGLQYLHYGIFSFVLVICYRNTDTQMILSLINTIWFVGYVIALRPPNDKFWKLEQAILHLLIFIINLLLSIVIFDQRYNNISNGNKARIQTAIAIIMFIIIVWNFFMLLYGLIRRMQNCSKAKLRQQHLINNTNYNQIHDQKNDQQMNAQNDSQYVSVHEQNQHVNHSQEMLDFFDKFKEDSGDDEYSANDTSYLTDNFNSQNYIEDNYENNKHRSLDSRDIPLARKFTFSPTQFNKQIMDDETISFQKQDQRFKDEVINFHNNKKTIKGLNAIKEEDSDEDQFVKIPRYTN